MDWSSLQRKLYKLLCIGSFRGRLDPEARIQKTFVDKCRVWSIDGKLKAVWCAICNENSNNDNKLFGIKLQHLGKIKGAPDLIFLWDEGAGCIEFKSLKGRQTEQQKIFEEWCKYLDVKYLLVRDVAEAEIAIRKWGILV